MNRHIRFESHGHLWKWYIASDRISFIYLMWHTCLPTENECLTYRDKYSWKNRFMIILALIYKKQWTIIIYITYLSLLYTARICMIKMSFRADTYTETFSSNSNYSLRCYIVEVKKLKALHLTMMCWFCCVTFTHYIHTNNTKINTLRSKSGSNESSCSSVTAIVSFTWPLFPTICDPCISYKSNSRVSWWYISWEKGLAKQVQLICLNVRLTWPKWIFFVLCLVLLYCVQWKSNFKCNNCIRKYNCIWK